MVGYSSPSFVIVRLRAKFEQCKRRIFSNRYGATHILMSYFLAEIACIYRTTATSRRNLRRRDIILKLERKHQEQYQNLLKANTWQMKEIERKCAANRWCNPLSDSVDNRN